MNIRSTACALFGIGALAFATGCSHMGNEVKSGMDRYEVGNYNEAVNACVDLSADQASMDERSHVRYLVYCGLTQYRVGNRTEARALLAQGKTEYARGVEAAPHQAWLKPAIQNEMLKAIDDLSVGTATAMSDDRIRSARVGD